jgi:hypothetical protein
MEDLHPDPSWLYTPPLSSVQPPVETKLSALPFDQLTWQDFERLCHRLVRVECNIEYSKPYDVQGSTQEGIDIYGRITNSEEYTPRVRSTSRIFAIHQFASSDWPAKLTLRLADQARTTFLYLWTLLTRLSCTSNLGV